MENFKGIDIFCAFEEDVESPEKYVRWYESPPGTTLFHITKFPISGKYFEAQIEEEIEHRWGRTPELNQIQLINPWQLHLKMSTVIGCILLHWTKKESKNIAQDVLESLYLQQEYTLQF